MSDKPYTVLAFFEAKPGKEDELKAVLSSLVTPSLQEEGCVTYVLHQSQDEPTKFMFYENWSSKEALMQHGQTPHIIAWRAKRDELLIEPNQASFWEMVS